MSGRPQPGQARRLRHSSRLFEMPDMAIRPPAAVQTANTKARCGSIACIVSLCSRRRVSSGNLPPARVRVRREVRLLASPVADVGVQLGRPEVGVTEQLLEAAQVG